MMILEEHRKVHPARVAKIWFIAYSSLWNFRKGERKI